MAANQLVSENFASPQSGLNQPPTTMAQALTIKPVSKLTFLTGATQIKWIGTLVAAQVNPTIAEHADPVQDGYHELVFIPDTGSTVLLTGNIATEVIMTANVPNMLFYDPNTRKYYGFAGNVT